MSVCIRLFHNNINIIKNGNFTTLQQKSFRILPRFGLIGMSTSSHMVKEKEEFHNVLPNIIDSLVANPAFNGIPDAAAWIRKILFHNVTGGDNSRGLTTVLGYEMTEKPDNVTEKSLKLARTLGWCVEMAYLVILDDIIDGSSTRRGMPCWYRKPDVGIGCAINDSIIMYTALFQILRNNFSNKLNYLNMIHAFNETLFYTTIGQHLDCKLPDIKKKDYSLFTIDRYSTMVVYKTAYYTFKLPISLGLLLSDCKVDEATEQQILDICLEMGKLFQIQDDFIDCYGDESVTGKAGSDIQESKCTWLAVTALECCSEAQRVVFTACYGSKEPAHVERIKRLYDLLQLPEVFREQECAIYGTILQRVHELPTDELRTLFCKVLENTYKRKK